ncbi:MAG: protease modulator HflC [Acetobacteraceae bacterium]|nr:protease modulator HflC [Acetobacteraceae bacterium]MSP29346.1 protease modulator HflC [Acetobacteraceae bacterium]
MSRALAALVVVLGLGAVTLSQTLFTVDVTGQVLVVQLGRPVRPIDQPGLYTKIPFIQNVLSFDRRALTIELPGEEVILGDQRRLIVDSFTVFRITNSLQYYQSVGGTEMGIKARLSSVVSSSLRRVLGNNTLLAVLSADRTRIMATIRTQVNDEMKSFGISVDDVRIRRADLPGGNTQAILARMQSERERIARQARAEGAEAAQRIRADAEQARTILVAEANATAERLRGEGEGEATRIYNRAFGADQNFFTAWRTMQAYREALGNGSTRIILSPEADFLKFLRTPPTTETR